MSKKIHRGAEEGTKLGIGEWRKERQLRQSLRNLAARNTTAPGLPLRLRIGRHREMLGEKCLGAQSNPPFHDWLRAFTLLRADQDIPVQ